MLAPVALFVYNRPWHTRETITSLQNNELAADTELYIFSDGPKTEADRISVEEVRRYLRTITGFRMVTYIEREKNLGLAESIIAGVTDIVNKYGRIIVLEDDLVTSPFFLRYMNDALEYYRHEGSVMHVSAGTYPVGDYCGDDDTYFLRIPLCWGWGTWKRAWDKFERNVDIMQQFNDRMVSRFNFDGTNPFWAQLELNRDGRLNTWFVFWYAAVFLNEALALFPKRVLVKNIGFDGTGVHCGDTHNFDVELCPDSVTVSYTPLRESDKAVYQYKQCFLRLYPLGKPALLSRLIGHLKRLVSA